MNSERKFRQNSVRLPRAVDYCALLRICCALLLTGCYQNPPSPQPEPHGVDVALRRYEIELAEITRLEAERDQLLTAIEANQSQRLGGDVDIALAEVQLEASQFYWQEVEKLSRKIEAKEKRLAELREAAGL